MGLTKLSTYELIEHLERKYIALRMIEFLSGKRKFKRVLKHLKETIIKFSDGVSGCIFDHNGVYQEHFYEMFESFTQNPLDIFKKYSKNEYAHLNYSNYFNKGLLFSVQTVENPVASIAHFCDKNNIVSLNSFGEVDHSFVRRIFTEEEKKEILNL